MHNESPPTTDTHAEGTHAAGFHELHVEFGKGLLRLSLREWIVAGFILAVCFVGVPAIWQRYEPLETPRDFRIPYARSEDYWSYEREIERIVRANRIPVIGDSVVWGEYVAAGDTLSSRLNKQIGSDRFANVGLNGAHPLALEGLVRNYAGSLSHRRVILHCNLLWMSSPDRDLQTDKEMPFNHPRLVPQFVPRVPSYKAPLSRRLSVVVDRSLEFFGLIDHVRTCDFDGQDLHSWSIANPRANPLTRLEGRPEESFVEPNHAPVSWIRQGLTKQDLPWINLDSSLQWRAWRGAVDSLLDRGNQLLVIVGPFNEHMLPEPSRQRYRALVQKVEDWLRTRKIPFIAPELLPSEQYGDASHPLSEGYAALARTISADRVFQEWLKEPRGLAQK